MLKSMLFIFCVRLFFAATVEGTGNGRIFGGTTAIDRQFPFAAAIYSTHPGVIYFTTGILITDQWVLTMPGSSESATSVEVILGSINRTATDSNSRSVQVDLVSYSGDLALLRLETPVALSEYIKPISFLASSPAAGSSVLTLGWGLTEEGSGIPDNLLYILLSVIDNEACAELIGAIEDYIICGTGINEQQICGGDIGGPLFYYNRDDVYLVGVARSFNTECAGGPSRFVRIDAYMDWISSTTGAKIAL